MKKTLALLSALLLLAGCAPNREKQLKAIEEHELTLSSLDIIADDSDIDAVLALYRTFAADFPDDSLAPVFLQRAADLDISIGRQQEAVDLLDTIIDLYPGYEDLGGCWFLKGHAYESSEQYDQAREAYTHFVENYPDHVLAKDIKWMLDNNLVGLSPEEQLERILAGAES